MKYFNDLNGRPKGKSTLYWILLGIGYYSFIGLITYFLYFAPVLGVITGLGLHAVFTGFLVLLLTASSFAMFFFIYIVMAAFGIVFSPDSFP